MSGEIRTPDPASIRKDGPAFPSPGHSFTNREGITFQKGVQAGMTLLQWYAAHAPERVPEWYQCALNELPQVPGASQAVRLVIGERGLAEKFDLEAINGIANSLDDYEWADEDLYLPQDHPKSIAKAASDYIWALREQREQVVRENQGLRYFHWRWHYAEVMVRMGGF